MRFEDVSADVFGHDELAGATLDFQQRSKDGVGGLVDDTEVIHRRLVDSVEEYRRVDSEIAEIFQRVEGFAREG